MKYRSSLFLAITIIVMLVLGACDSPIEEDTILQNPVESQDDIFEDVKAEIFMESVNVAEETEVDKVIDILDWQSAYAEYLNNFNYGMVRCAYVEDINRDDIPEIVFGIADEPLSYFISYYSEGEIKEISEMKSNSWWGYISYSESADKLLNKHGTSHYHYYDFYDYRDGKYQKTLNLTYWWERIVKFEPDYYAENAARIEALTWYYCIDGANPSEGFIEDYYESTSTNLIEEHSDINLFYESISSELGFDIYLFENIIRATPHRI